MAKKNPPVQKPIVSMDPAQPGSDQTVVAEFSADHEIGKGLTPKSSSENSDIANHPKFDKFKKGSN